MSDLRESTIRIAVDATNPGQFFACCGLLELADRLWGGAEAWFEGDQFVIRVGANRTLPALLRWFKEAPLVEEVGGVEGKPVNEEGDEGSETRVLPITVALPGGLQLLRLDWWSDKSLKPWAGSMDARVIFVAMKDAIDPSAGDPLNDSAVVFDPPAEGGVGKSSVRKGKKREPFYFDARRGAASRSIDIGFAPDALQMRSMAFPAVEALALVGLQRCRPSPAGRPRLFDYFTWAAPLTPLLAPAGVNGLLSNIRLHRYRFENAFRTDQRKHKAYCPSTPMHGDRDD